MPTKNQAIHDDELDSFARLVEDALKHINNPEWLGSHSLLASPYVLGSQLEQTSTVESPTQRGLLLQRLLQTAASQLDPELQKLLKIRYFVKKTGRSSDALANEIGGSRSTFFRLRIDALQALATALNHLLFPTLRNESPPYTTLIGRTSIVTRVLTALSQQQSVSIVGTSGVGKSALGASIMERWFYDHAIDPSKAQTHPVWWFTVRNGLNDQLASFVFALGLFLRQHGFSSTWRQLVADAGTVKPERVLALLRYDLTQAATLPLLFCIDDLEALQPERTDHNQILHLIEELCLLKAVLLIGQRPLLQTDEQINLGEFTLAETTALLAHTAISELDQAAAEQIHRNTRGNAAKLTLFIALLRGGESLADSLSSINDAPSLESLFYRIWRKLSEQERFLLMRLAVFRTPSPQDAWVNRQEVLHRLLQRQLVSFDRQGGVELLSHIRKLVYERTPPELRTDLHFQAAMIRSTRRERISAMYHYWKARRPVLVIWEWFPNRRNEIERGHGAAALKILAELVETDLTDEQDQNVLRVSLAELLQLTGRAEEAEAKLARIRGEAKEPFYAYVSEIQADLLEIRGQLEQAAAKYRSSLDTFTRIIDHREVILHTKLVFLYLYRMHNVEQARMEALQARAKAEAFHGLIEEMAGNFVQARQLYESARQIAENSGNDLVTLSRIYTYTSSVTLKQGEYETAVTWIEKAIECDRKRGDSVGPLYDIMNLAYVYTLAGRYDEALRHALDGLHIAEKMNHSYLVAGLAAGVGEACYYLQRIEEAEFYALQSLNQEEEFFRSWALVLLGMVRHQQGRSAEGINLAQQGAATAHQIDDKYVEAYAKRVLADIYRDTNQAQHAVTAYHSALQIYTALKLDKESKQVQEALVALGVNVSADRETVD